MLCISLWWTPFPCRVSGTKKSLADKTSSRDQKGPSDIQYSGTSGTKFIRDGSQARSSFYIMPRKRKHCPICGKRKLLKLSNHFADIHELSSEQRQPFLIRATIAPSDLETVLTELYNLIGNMMYK